MFRCNNRYDANPEHSQSQVANGVSCDPEVKSRTDEYQTRRKHITDTPEKRVNSSRRFVLRLPAGD